MQTPPESFFNREDEILEADNQIGEEIQQLSREDRRSLFRDIFAHMNKSENEKAPDDQQV